MPASHIRLDVVVTDSSGKSVTGLLPSDFTLLDNNQPDQVRAFRAFDGTPQNSEPVQVLLLIDNVNEDVRRIEAAEQQIEQFFRQNGGHLAHPVSIIVLTDDGLQLQPKPSTDGNALADQINHIGASIRPLGSDTGVNGAIERMGLSVDALTALLKSQSRWPEKKMLIWLDPGWAIMQGRDVDQTYDQQKKIFSTIIELSTLLRQSRMTICSVAQGMPSVDSYRYKDFLKGVTRDVKAIPPDLNLRVLAVQSGGIVMDTSNDIVGQLNSCFADTTAYYSLVFDPPPAQQPNEYHDLSIKIDKPGLTARTTTGYYNQP
jgi:VWFA-related protein